MDGRRIRLRGERSKIFHSSHVAILGHMVMNNHLSIPDYFLDFTLIEVRLFMDWTVDIDP